MLGFIAKLSLVSTALAPVLVTNAYAHWVRGTFSTLHVVALIVAALLTLLCILIIKGAQRSLEVIDPFAIDSIKTADKEIVGFVVAYLFPLMNLTPVRFSGRTMAFVFLVLFFVIVTTHSYHFNPLLGLFGYHFYEVSTPDKVSYVLITRRDMRSRKDVKRVVRLTDYMVMEKSS